MAGVCLCVTLRLCVFMHVSYDAYITYNRIYRFSVWNSKFASMGNSVAAVIWNTLGDCIQLYYD